MGGWAPILLVLDILGCFLLCIPAYRQHLCWYSFTLNFFRVTYTRFNYIIAVEGHRLAHCRFILKAPWTAQNLRQLPRWGVSNLVNPATTIAKELRSPRLPQHWRSCYAITDSPMERGTDFWLDWMCLLRWRALKQKQQKFTGQCRTVYTVPRGRLQIPYTKTVWINQQIQSVEALLTPEIKEDLHVRYFSIIWRALKQQASEAALDIIARLCRWAVVGS